MELLASPSLFFAFLAGTAFGDLLAGCFPLSFVSPRGELMSSGRLFVRPRIAWVSWLISSEEAAVLSLSCREACAGTALRSSGSESLWYQTRLLAFSEQSLSCLGVAPLPLLWS